MTRELRKGPTGPVADLTSSDIENVSGAPGETVSDVLDALVQRVVTVLGSDLLAPIVRTLQPAGHRRPS
jgi:hypothetical protein